MMYFSNKKITKVFFGVFILAVFFVPAISFGATTKLEYSAWMPYWKKASSTADMLPHLTTFSEVSPFSYTVKTDGTIVDTARITQEPWKSFLISARAKKVKIIPSILWTDPDAMHKVLKTYTLRIAQEKAIMKIVTDNNFDGIDIDYENKKAETKKYFSYFLQELQTALHKKNKILTCTIEPRTPLDSRFKNIPTDIAYANDYAALNAYCDRVRIMTYDQVIVDLLLNAEKGSSTPYAPVADTSWVKKVVKLASNVIRLNKIVIGVPTYGYEFRVTPDGKWFDYERLRSINHDEAVALAKKVGATPARNSAGELSFMYYSPNDVSTSTATSTTSSKKTFRLVWWSDSFAIADKVNLAKSLGVRGVAIFKIDGGEDQGIWNVLK
ncbi:MAG: glycosyl hydrolase family 18 protein [Candidatus Parcubacteria bacterium]|nr:glycosyl hydrolase family 18 protein [Candidatus Parcubacteria bacterium]